MLVCVLNASLISVIREGPGQVTPVVSFLRIFIYSLFPLRPHDLVLLSFILSIDNIRLVVLVLLAWFSFPTVTVVSCHPFPAFASLRSFVIRTK